MNRPFGLLLDYVMGMWVAILVLRDEQAIPFWEAVRRTIGGFARIFD